MTVEDGSQTSEQRFFSVRVEADLHERILNLAKKNDRPVSAEIRVALRQYIELQEQAA